MLRLIKHNSMVTSKFNVILFKILVVERCTKKLQYVKNIGRETKKKMVFM